MVEEIKTEEWALLSAEERVVMCQIMARSRQKIAATAPQDREEHLSLARQLQELASQIANGLLDSDASPPISGRTFSNV